MKPRLTVGTVARPQGVRGELKITPLTDDSGRFSRLERCYIGDTEYRIESARVSVSGVYLKLRGVDDRDTAERLRGGAVEIAREDAVELPEGRYFIADLLGAEVRTQSGVLGVLADVLQYGSADVYVIEETAGKRAMIPAIERVVLAVDTAEKIVTLDEQAYGDLVVYEN